VAATTARSLRLLSLLQSRRDWPGAELAGRLGVSARTLRRDVDALRELGYPVRARRGVDGGYQLAPGASLPPLLLDDDEAVALVVGLQTAAQGALAGTAEASVRALAKVAQVMPRRLRRRVDALGAMTVPASWGPAGAAVGADLLSTLAEACRDEERVELSYTAGSGDRTERRVEPHRLVALGRRWYLVAHDLDRGDWRTFRLDRVASARGTGERFRPRELPAADAAAFVRARLEQRAAPQQVTALVHAPAGAVRDRIGRWAQVEEAGPGTCRVRMAADALEWPALALGMAGAPLSEVAPAELRAVLGEWGARFSAAARQ
jgi:predicted DNA-binding transcriptional regulator YafY